MLFYGSMLLHLLFWGQPASLTHAAATIGPWLYDLQRHRLTACSYSMLVLCWLQTSSMRLFYTATLAQPHPFQEMGLLCASRKREILEYCDGS